MLAVDLNGGLGNQLFQLAAAETVANETARTMCILNSTSPKTVHTSANYFDSVLAPWETCPHLPTPYTVVDEQSYAKPAWSAILPKDESICLRGYFQNWLYIPSSFPTRLRLSFSPPLHGAFLHIRGGDYVNHWLHDVGLSRGYYQRAVKEFPPGTHFYVFTNDMPYAKTLAFLSNVPHTYMESDELTALAQMASCTEGGICANSSFSWWGAYLNQNRTIVMPDKWFVTNGVHTDGYYFPNVRKCPV